MKTIVFDPKIIAWQLLRTCGVGRVLLIAANAGAAGALLPELRALGFDAVAVATDGSPMNIASRLDQLPFADGAFDSILAVNCLDEKTDAELPTILHEWRRVCRRSLLLLASTAGHRSRRDWEQQLFAAGFARHPRFLVAADYRTLDHRHRRTLFAMEVRQGDAADALSTPGADATLYRYHQAASFVRPGDTVADLGHDAAAGLYLLRHNCRAAKTISVDEQALAERSDGSVDVLLAFGVELSPGLLKNIHRVLIPGGRAVVDSSGWSQWSRDALAAGLLLECADIPGLGTTLLSDPLTPLPGLVYRETVFANLVEANPACIQYARYYRNPWIVHSLVHVGYRTKSPALLTQLALRLLREESGRLQNKQGAASLGLADYGAALCVLAYRALQLPIDELPTDDLLRQIDDYVGWESDSPHVTRWKISLTFVRGQLKQRQGDLRGAMDDFRRCTMFDPLAFSPHLATKTADAFFRWGWLAMNLHEPDQALLAWQKGVDFGRTLLAVPFDDVLMNRSDPNLFDFGDGPRELVLALESITQCANALHLLNRPRDGTTDWTDAWRSFGNKAEGLRQDLRQAQLSVTDLNAELDQARDDLRQRTEEADQARGELRQRTEEADQARGELRQRTEEADQAREDLRSRTGEVDQARIALAQRTTDLVTAQKDLVDRTAELDQARADLRERTKELDAVRQELIDRTAEVDQARADLAERTRELEEARK